jgi:DNA-directed RNA polymerase specialized sigma24 family protein
VLTGGSRSDAEDLVQETLMRAWKQFCASAPDVPCRAWLIRTMTNLFIDECVTRNTDYGLYLIDIDHENGGMTVNSDFFVDFDNVQKKNTVGAARPHQVFFDPNIRQGFGEH